MYSYIPVFELEGQCVPLVIADVDVKKGDVGNAVIVHRPHKLHHGKSLVDPDLVIYNKCMEAKQFT